MHEAVFWVAFVGSWLLVAGPAFQAVLELREEEEAHARFESAIARVAPPAPVSRRWWLLPPVAIVLHSRRRGTHRRAITDAMSAEDLDAVGHYMAVARGWMTVGAGAWCLFLKETWELAEHEEWPVAGYWVLVLVMTLLALGTAGASGSRER